MENKLDRIESKVDRIVSDVGEIKIVAAAQHQSLKDHMRRTAIAEQRLDQHDKFIFAFLGAIKFSMKLVGVLAAVGGAVEGAVALLNYLGK